MDKVRIKELQDALVKECLNRINNANESKTHYEGAVDGINSLVAALLDEGENVERDEPVEAQSEEEKNEPE